MKDSEIIRFSPSAHDVISGRGGYRYHPGNAFYHSLLRKCALRPCLTTRDVDDMVEAILYAIVERRHGRFVRPLEDDKNLAVVLDRKPAALKIRCDLRTWRTRRNTRTGQAKTLLSSEHRPKTIPTKTCKPQSQVISKPPTTTLTTTKKTIGYGIKEVGGKIRLCGFVNGDDFDDDSHSSQQAVPPSGKLTVVTSNRTKPLPNAVPKRVLFPHPPVSTSSSLIKIRKSKSLCEPGRSDQTHPQSLLLYGSAHDEVHMRRWLNTYQLPQTVADVFLELGARSVDDVFLLVKSQPKMLQQLAVLDMVKLQGAVKGK